MNTLAKHRREKGLTLKQAARKMGLRESTLRTYESSKPNSLAVGTQEAMCKIYGISPDFFLCGGKEGRTAAQEKTG
jgi:transcriptional regulator with XRE-family HTH domain